MERNMSIIGFLGSSRADGNTAALTNAVFSELKSAVLVDLSELMIGPYSYDNAYAADDFLPLARPMAKADAIVFASPVYWYSMSAQMKAFFDRLTDLTEGEMKPVGKSLAGKRMFVIATGNSPTAPDSFVRPFADTAGYFNMRWGGLFYAQGAGELSAQTRAAAKAFASKIHDAAMPASAAAE